MRRAIAGGAGGGGGGGGAGCSAATADEQEGSAASAGFWVVNPRLDQTRFCLYQLSNGVSEDALVIEADDARWVVADPAGEQGKRPGPLLPSSQLLLWVCQPIAEDCDLPIWIDFRGTADGARPDACQDLFLGRVCEEDLARGQIVATLLPPKRGLTEAG